MKRATAALRCRGGHDFAYLLVFRLGPGNSENRILACRRCEYEPRWAEAAQVAGTDPPITDQWVSWSHWRER